MFGKGKSSDWIELGKANFARSRPTSKLSRKFHILQGIRIHLRTLSHSILHRWKVCLQMAAWQRRRKDSRVYSVDWIVVHGQRFPRTWQQKAVVYIAVVWQIEFPQPNKLTSETPISSAESNAVYTRGTLSKSCIFSQNLPEQPVFRLI